MCENFIKCQLRTKEDNDDDKFITDIITKMRQAHLELDPLVREFQEFVENNPQLHMQYSHMFTNPSVSDQSPSNMKQQQQIISSYHEMFRIVNYIILSYAPPFTTNIYVGVPINAILCPNMTTAYGSVAFIHKEANEYWRKVLNKWGEFLKSPASTYVLVRDEEWGWFSEAALTAMPNFVEEFVCDSSEPHYGFKSWDDFFTRAFRENARPISTGRNASACEAQPYNLQYDVQMMDRFWIKEQYYSLKHMLGDNRLGHEFRGGTVYQAFLSAFSYHRWHSPVDGVVVKTYIIPGAYYAASWLVGEDNAAACKSQGYICHFSTRAVVIIRADNPAIGMMGFMAVGMGEVSSDSRAITH